MSSGKVMIIYLMIGLIIKILLYTNELFFAPYGHSENKIEVK